MGYKRKYVRIVEKILGHALPVGAIVHHVDRDRTNSATNNLCVLQSHREHSQLHKRMRLVKAGVNPWTQQICATCKQVKDLTDFSTRRATTNGLSVECRACVAKRVHTLWCVRTGREVRKETPEEMSLRQSRTATSRWRKVREERYSNASV